jgi:diacylglycerol kinase
MFELLMRYAGAKRMQCLLLRVLDVMVSMIDLMNTEINTYIASSSPKYHIAV